MVWGGVGEQTQGVFSSPSATSEDAFGDGVGGAFSWHHIF